MDSGTNVYISRVNKVIHLFKGADSSWHQKIRDCLSIFLKGTKKKKAKLMIDHPDDISTKSGQCEHSTWSETYLLSMFTI